MRQAPLWVKAENAPGLSQPGLGIGFGLVRARWEKARFLAEIPLR